MEAPNEYHVLFFAIIDPKQGKPLVHYFNEAGKTHFQEGIQNYGSIERALDAENVLHMIQNKINFSSLSSTGGEIKILSQIIPDYLIYVRPKSPPQSNETAIFELAICYKDTPKSLPLSILNEDNKPFDYNQNQYSKAIEKYIVDYELAFNNQIQKSHDGTAAAEQELAEIVDIMNDNINQVLLRDEALDQLHQKTLKLSTKGTKFKRTTWKTERREVWRNRKWKLIAAGTVISLSVVVVSLYSTQHPEIY